MTTFSGWRPRLLRFFGLYNGASGPRKDDRMSSPGQRQPSNREHDDELASDEQRAAYEAGLARIEARVRREHPELFDEHGEPRAEMIGRLLDERLGGESTLTGEEFPALIEPGLRRLLADAP
jgi:hypothetical protein